MSNLYQRQGGMMIPTFLRPLLRLAPSAALESLAAVAGPVPGAAPPATGSLNGFSVQTQLKFKLVRGSGEHECRSVL